MPAGLVQAQSAEGRAEKMAVWRAEQANQELLPQMECLQWQVPDAHSSASLTRHVGHFGMLHGNFWHIKEAALAGLHRLDRWASCRRPLRVPGHDSIVMLMLRELSRGDPGHKSFQGLTFWLKAVLKLMDGSKPVLCCMVWHADTSSQTTQTCSLLRVARLKAHMLGN